MKRHMIMGVIGVVMILSAGCGTVQKSTNVQKGAAVGGGTLGAVGATAGHLTSLGGVPGGLIGLGLGATTGAIVADYYYPDDMPEMPSVDKMETMREQLGKKESQVDTLRTRLEKQEAQRKALIEAHEETREELQSLRNEMGSENVSVSRNQQGHVKMTILSDVLFDSGEADLTEEGTEVLSEAARKIRKNYPDATIEVRGHTDNVPIQKSGWKSNWELSSHRAIAVLHLLIDKFNIPRKQVRAVGMADTQPVASNDTAEGRSKNRRAEIIIRPQP